MNWESRSLPVAHLCKRLPGGVHLPLVAAVRANVPTSVLPVATRSRNAYTPLHCYFGRKVFLVEEGICKMFPVEFSNWTKNPTELNDDNPALS